MQFIDLITQKNRIRSSLLQRFEAILDHGQFIMGPEVCELESQLAAYTGSRFCVSCSSGTDALLMPLLAKDVGPGDAVITTPFTFIATAEVISLSGATPVFADIDPATFNIDPGCISGAVREATEKGLNPKVLIPVDLFGLPADYESLDTIAAGHGLWILEDAAQSFGSSTHGRRAGSFGLAAATSFFPAKPLGCYGDGGAVFTDDAELDLLLRSVRVHGSGADKYSNDRIGINGRLDSMQAAVLLEKLVIFDEELAARQRVAEAYGSRLRSKLAVPAIPDGSVSAWAQYSLLASSGKERDDIMAALLKEGIPSAIYYKIPLHLQKAFSSLGYREGDFPVSEEMSRRVFSLPMHPYLSEEEIGKICSVVAACV
ncbi:MAG: DegT/DnrJ/EryC1/StrS family aminotransferase [Chlorobium sp.]|jgi:dTDP-4-amino-4,6-dideoxygalactose transaminase|uniref:DegT/DnrJ/EryC1/StrS family aminotransferase n=1 Tax=Chlorobium sp. TaxID=1095 RepID=UPI001E0D3D48|nr:DegT/DnrJ/EryC1/StrS family aminotransferase [Chlorobium sp.]MBN1279625.1 DegT/DnrJ/EryC1/StrS family aminotransferase [Chlorobiaceae bacterium]MCF8215623.1 DegT/DnrJ/EryC1/StrS family aminotransferase [Chlorobium sp.]MCF8270678.1 DegT/DnrJ/EryC1/StrS family aminotransferase [Chlorobium sp.]MCF8286832.1 DegT/DnrJ/EryC1/StrS family aminotransferase [Chlorobium sp.]MCF8290592.1 DegT/DnrJ/EryC1/StrS family aminotransferase [Chlorobium sp.]